MKMTRISNLLVAFSATIGLCSNARAWPGATFTPLGDLPGGNSFSRAGAVSADGAVVVGTSFSGFGSEAFRWEDGVMVGLGDLPEQGFTSEAHGVSADGTIVVGRGWSAASGSPFWSREAFRWQNGLMSPLGDLPGGSFLSEAAAVTPNGLIVVGRGFTQGNEAFRWESDMMTGLGELPGGGFESLAYGVSEDGSVTVGYSHSTFGSEAVRWVNGEIYALGDLPGGMFDSFAYDVSLDGQVIVGWGSSQSGIEAFQWANGVMMGLGDLSGGSFGSQARAVSGDGTVIVGSGTTEFGSSAMIWTEADGMREISDVLLARGVDGLTGWTLSIAIDISDDGTTIVGDGINPEGNSEAWQAYLGIETEIVASRFDTDAEGWTIVGDPVLDSPIPVWVSAGESDGFIRAVEDPRGVPMLFAAPYAYLGNQSDAYGGTLEFDLQQSSGNNQLTGTEDVMLIGANFKLVMDFGANPAVAPAWRHYSVLLTEEGGWRIGSLSGPPPSPEQFRAVLSSLDSLRICADFRNGMETVALDNVVLLGSPCELLADTDGDGDVDLADFSNLQIDFGYSCE